MPKPKAPAPADPNPGVPAPSPPAPANPDPNASVLTMPIPELQSRVAKAIDLWGQIVALFPGTVVLPAEERVASHGKLRTNEESALLAILKVTDAYPALFASLADLDEGLDPSKFESDLQRDRLARANALAPLAEAFATQPIGIDDTVLHLRGLVKDVASKAYAIAKSHAPTTQGLSTLLAPALDFYRALGKAAAAARAANAAAKAKAAKGP